MPPGGFAGIKARLSKASRAKAGLPDGAERQITSKTLLKKAELVNGAERQITSKTLCEKVGAFGGAKLPQRNYNIKAAGTLLCGVPAVREY